MPAQPRRGLRDERVLGGGASALHRGQDAGLDAHARGASRGRSRSSWRRTRRRASRRTRGACGCRRSRGQRRSRAASMTSAARQSTAASTCGAGADRGDGLAGDRQPAVARRARRRSGSSPAQVSSCRASAITGRRARAPLPAVVRLSAPSTPSGRSSRPSRPRGSRGPKVAVGVHHSGTLMASSVSAPSPLATSLAAW